MKKPYLPPREGFFICGANEKEIVDILKKYHTIWTVPVRDFMCGAHEKEIVDILKKYHTI